MPPQAKEVRHSHRHRYTCCVRSGVVPGGTQSDGSCFSISRALTTLRKRETQIPSVIESTVGMWATCRRSPAKQCRRYQASICRYWRVRSSPDEGRRADRLSQLHQRTPPRITIELGWAESEAQRIVSANLERIEHLANQLVSRRECGAPLWTFPRRRRCRAGSPSRCPR
jgi:hypothetical protein